jgi:hypothetical protein
LNIANYVKNYIPQAVKHPLIAGTNWIWKARSLPAQSRTDIEIFKDALADLGGDKIQVLEWGSGRSTFYYSEHMLAQGREFNWLAIENSGDWARISNNKLAGTSLESRIQIDCFEFPPFWELDGYYPDPSILAAEYDNNPNVENYVNHPRDVGNKFDLIFIDGRFRRRCLLTALDVLAPGGLVVLHDAWRTHYHSALDEYSNVRLMDTGRLPGSSLRSHIAICALEETLFFKGLCQKYSNYLTSVQQLSGT